MDPAGREILISGLQTPNGPLSANFVQHFGFIGAPLKLGSLIGAPLKPGSLIGPPLKPGALLVLHSNQGPYWWAIQTG